MSEERAGPPTAAASAGGGVVEVEHLWVPMADGVRLAARLWRPAPPPGVEAAAPPVPAIVEAIPYGKRWGTRWRDEGMHPRFARRGFAVLRLDVRGTGDSEGTIADEYTAREQADLDAVVAWLAAQPWCDGRVVALGKSWGGFAALQAAARRPAGGAPSSLAAAVSVHASDDRYGIDAHYMGGCLLVENAIWGASFLTLACEPPDPELVGDSWRSMWHRRLAAVRPFAAGWMEHPRRDAFWRHGSIAEDPAAVRCPVLAIGGWSDAYADAVPRLVETLPGPVTGIVGPWAHRYPHNGVPGPPVDFVDLVAGWLGGRLGGERRRGDEGGGGEGAERSAGEPRYRVWMPERRPPADFLVRWPGRWVAEDAWPSARIDMRRWRLVEERLAPLVTEGTDDPSTRGGWLGGDPARHDRADHEPVPVDARVAADDAPATSPPRSGRVPSSPSADPIGSGRACEDVSNALPATGGSAPSAPLADLDGAATARGADGPAAEPTHDASARPELLADRSGTLPASDAEPVGAAPGTPRVHRSQQSVGAAGGSWCPFGYPGDLPRDQHEDDRRSLTWESDPLPERLELLGAPEVELRLSVDRPAALLAIRLVDVAPDGSASRITYSLLNLAHRYGHERPRPLTRGEPLAVRLALRHAAWAVPAGHRLRLAVSTAYWPIAWPSPEPVTLTVLGGTVEIPVRPPAPEDGRLPPLPPWPEDAVEPSLDPEREPTTFGSERDEATGELIHWWRHGFADDGAPEMEEVEAIGLEVGHAMAETARVRDDDPLSAELVVEHRLRLRRGAWDVRLDTRTRLTATVECFRLETRVVAREGERVAAERRWDQRVARHLV